MGAILGLLPLLTTIFDRLIPDPVAREKAQTEATAMLLTAAQAQDASQNEVNKIEAGSPSLFIGGWRPFIGWLCGFALAWTFLVLPALKVFASLMGRDVALVGPMDDHLWELITAMLGLGGLRTVERVRGVAAGH